MNESTLTPPAAVIFERGTASCRDVAPSDRQRFNAIVDRAKEQIYAQGDAPLRSKTEALAANPAANRDPATAVETEHWLAQMAATVPPHLFHVAGDLIAAMTRHSISELRVNLAPLEQIDAVRLLEAAANRTLYLRQLEIANRRALSGSMAAVA